MAIKKQSLECEKGRRRVLMIGVEQELFSNGAKTARTIGVAVVNNIRSRWKELQEIDDGQPISKSH